jgi:hypothetical protein
LLNGIHWLILFFKVLKSSFRIRRKFWILSKFPFKAHVPILEFRPFEDYHFENKSFIGIEKKFGDLNILSGYLDVLVQNF